MSPSKRCYRRQRLRPGALAASFSTREQLDQILQPGEVLTQPRAFTVTTVGGEQQVENVAPKEIG